ncbi:trafficking protein particle complex subunit 11-like [Panonychus citri]|uniref:trafficking protein particle complex subunit 11-like n=1 Tax=Panonychus citri TaxID=50023 RepID=UPI00230724DC|nr:trafficking protein particle complex subunit 11-like [Panonychus citri]
MNDLSQRRLSTAGDSLYIVLGVPKTATPEEIKKAYRKFKKNKRLRMMRLLIVHIAQNYYDEKDYKNCLIHLNRVLPFFRVEKWKLILNATLTTALHAAYLSINPIEFVQLGFESISAWIPNEASWKLLIQQSVLNVLSHEPPCLLFPDLEAEENESITSSWRTMLSSSPFTDSPINMEMNTIASFIEIKPVFSQKVFQWQQPVDLKVYLLLNSPMPFVFDKLSLAFNEPYYNQFCEEISPSLNLEPMVMKCLNFNLIVRKEDCGKLLKITKISLYFGSQSTKVTFDWTFEDSTSDSQMKCFNSHNSCLPSPSSLITTINYPIKFYHIEPMLTTFLEPRKPNVNLKLINSSPALLNEMYPIEIVIANQDDYSIKDIFLMIVKVEDVTISMTTNQPAGVCTSFIFDGSPLPLGVNQSLTSSIVEPGSSLVKTVYLPINDLNPQRFIFTVYFTSTNSSSPTIINNDDNNICYQLKEMISIQVINPFNVSFTTCTPLNTPSRVIRLMEPFVLKVDISCLSPFTLELIDCNVELHQNIFHTLPYTPTNSNKLLRCGDKTDCHFALYSESQITQDTGLGVLVIRWRKSSSSSNENKQLTSDKLTNQQEQETSSSGFDQINTIKFNLPSVMVQNSFLYVETKLPKFGVTRESLLLTYNLANRTDNFLPISLSLEKSDNFMFAGNSSVKLSIPAKSQLPQLFVLYPLVCGHVALPKLKIIIYPETDDPIDMEDVLEDIVPSYLMVMPQRKINTPV